MIFLIFLIYFFILFVFICLLRAVLYRVTTKEKQAIELSYDHKPIRPDEKARILRSGGKIERVVHDGV